MILYIQLELNWLAWKLCSWWLGFKSFTISHSVLVYANAAASAAWMSLAMVWEQKDNLLNSEVFSY